MPEEIEPGTLLHNQRYRVVRKFGEGGMGDLYLAEDQKMRRYVAIKVARLDDPKYRSQFQKEAGYLQQLQHHTLPRVWDFFNDAQRDFLVMEYIPGEDLQTKVRREGQQPEWLVLRWADELLKALEYLHIQNPPIIHRDIKPSNLKLRQDETLVLVDFGIAKEYVPEQATVPGAEAISPGYSPPEQHRVGGKTDARSDLYSAGATLYFLLTGQTPPPAPDLETKRARLPEPIAVAPELSSGTNILLLRALGVKPRSRWSSAAEMRRAVNASLDEVDHDGIGLIYPPPGNDSPDPEKTLFRPLTPVKDLQSDGRRGSGGPARNTLKKLKSVVEAQKVLTKSGMFRLSIAIAATPLRVAASLDGILYIAWDCGQIQAYTVPQGNLLFTASVFNSSRAKILDLAAVQPSMGQPGCFVLISEGGQCKLVQVTSDENVDLRYDNLNKHTVGFTHHQSHLYLMEVQARTGTIVYSPDDGDTLIGIPECGSPVGIFAEQDSLFVIGISQQGQHCLWQSSVSAEKVWKRHCWKDDVVRCATWCPYDESVFVLVKSSTGVAMEMWQPAAKDRIVLSPRDTEFEMKSSIGATRDFLLLLDPLTPAVYWHGHRWLRQHVRIEKKPFNA